MIAGSEKNARLNPAIENCGGTASGLDPILERRIQNLLRANSRRISFLDPRCFRAGRHRHETFACWTRKFRNSHIFGCWWFNQVPSLIEDITRMADRTGGGEFHDPNKNIPTRGVLDQIVLQHGGAQPAVIRQDPGGKVTRSWAQTSGLADHPRAPGKWKRDVRTCSAGPFERFLRSCKKSAGWNDETCVTQPRFR